MKLSLCEFQPLLPQLLFINVVIIKFYDNFPQLNGNNTQDEDIADNGGYKEAYNAYNVWTEQHGVEQRLPGLQEYTPQQMFWMSAANVMCSEYSPERLKYIINNDSHSPNRFRIIGSFSNLEEFSKDFQCMPGSYMNPVKKCQIW